MRSINKRELFIQSWDLFKGNAQFLINIGVLVFVVQMLIPNLLDGFFNQMSIQYILYRLTYLLIVTGITLGVTAQLIKVTRLMTIESFSDIFNYYHKIMISIMGSVLVALAFGVLAVIFIILFMGVSSLSVTSMENIIASDEISGPLMIGFMGYVIIIAYL